MKNISINSTSKGFTLVELSIVLVIIGLLIGGILVAQSMISTARAQTYIRHLQQYEVAITNFNTSYRGIPGDSTLFSPAGDGNGILDSTGCKGAYYGVESTQVWAHLSQARMIDKPYEAYQPQTGCSGTHSFTEEMSFFNNIPQAAGITSPDFSKKSPFGVHPFTANGALAFFSKIEGQDVLAIDTKLDNGDVTTGKFWGGVFDLGRECQVGDDSCYIWWYFNNNQGTSTLWDWMA